MKVLKGSVKPNTSEERMVPVAALKRSQANGVRASTGKKVPYFKNWPSPSPKIFRLVRLLEDITLLCSFFFFFLTACTKFPRLLKVTPQRDEKLEAIL